MTPEHKQELFNSVDVDRLITMRLARLYVPGYTRDDLIQEGRLSAWVALDSFNPERGKLESYLTRTIKHRFIKLIRATQTAKRTPPGQSVSFDEVNSVGMDLYEFVIDDSPTVEDDAIATERANSIQRAVAKCREQVGADERRVMNCYMQPEPELRTMLRNLGRRKLSKLALARYLEITPDCLHGMIRRIRRELSPMRAELA